MLLQKAFNFDFNEIASVIEERGWIQKQSRSKEGVCLISATHLATKDVSNLGYIVASVLSKRDRGISWNDLETTSKENVLAYLKSAPRIKLEEVRAILPKSNVFFMTKEENMVLQRKYNFFTQKWKEFNYFKESMISRSKRLI
jgi:hypothetical protein